LGGDYSVYDYGGEILHATHYYFHGSKVAALLLTNNNTAGISLRHSRKITDAANLDDIRKTL